MKVFPAPAWPVLLLSLLSLPGPVRALPFNLGVVEAQLDTRLDYSLAWATEAAAGGRIGANNGGNGLSTASDDGRLNYARGDNFSRLFELDSALELRYQESGLYLHGRYWSDAALLEENQAFKPVEEGGRQQGAKSQGGELLEAFVYQGYQLEPGPGTLRLGRQTIHWGEALFIGSGLTALNPQDAQAWRQPVTPLREGQLPANQLYLSQGLGPRWQVEAFYQLSWEANLAENCGTFFAPADYAAPGCVDNLAVLQTRDALTAGQVAALQGLGVTWGQPDEGVRVARAPDREPGDSGQFGLALHYFAEPWDTRLGFYALHYHSRSAYLGVQSPDAAVYAAALGQGALAPLVVAGNSRYFMGYPEDVRVYGLSFASTLRDGTTWAGELSHRPNAPLQLSPVDLLSAPQTPLDADQSPLALAPGSTLEGYERKAVSQWQTSLSQVVEQVMGARQLLLQGEVALVHVAGLESRHQARYGRDPVYGAGALPAAACEARNAAQLQAAGASLENVARYCDGDGFVTSTAWGYRLRATWEYSDVLPGLLLRPSLAWAEDVSGYAADPQFSEGNQALGLGLDLEYEHVYRAGLAYSRFFGGRFNGVADRDFLLLSLGIGF